MLLLKVVNVVGALEVIAFFLLFFLLLRGRDRDLLAVTELGALDALGLLIKQRPAYLRDLALFGADAPIRPISASLVRLIRATGTTNGHANADADPGAHASPRGRAAASPVDSETTRAPAQASPAATARDLQVHLVDNLVRLMVPTFLLLARVLRIYHLIHVIGAQRNNDAGFLLEELFENLLAHG